MLVLFDMAEHIALVREYKTLYIDYYALVAYCGEKVYRKALENLTKAENAKNLLSLSIQFYSSIEGSEAPSEPKFHLKKTKNNCLKAKHLPPKTCLKP